MKTLLMIGMLVAANPATAGTEWKAEALEEIKAEQNVVEAMWSRPSILWVSMRDDGSRRDGYADYLCMVLRDHGKPDKDRIRIRIWDAYAMAREELKDIGSSWCE